MTHIKIDGSILEGGGQILRNSIALSAILSKPVQINNIRAARKTPGLRAQHLTGIKLVGEMFNAKVIGAKIGSTSLTFIPYKFIERDYMADIQTAGATMLLLQISLPCIYNHSINLVLKGGTDASMAPPVDYIRYVFKPVINLMGLDFDIDIKRRGFFPKGGGEVLIKTKGTIELKPLVLPEQGELTKIQIITYVCSNKKMDNKMVDIATKSLESFNCPITYIDSTTESTGFGSGILIVGILSSGGRISGSSRTDKNINQEQAVNEAVNEFTKNFKSGGAIDEFLQDQVVIYAALANGHSVVKIGEPTLHTKTSVHFISMLTGRDIEIKEGLLVIA